MDFIAIIKLIIDLISGCKQDGRSKDEIKKSLASPGRRERIQLYRELRRRGHRGRELRDAYDDVMAQQEVCTGIDFDGLIEDA
jgi:hypothetical protein